MTPKYRPTPFNIISVGLILISIYGAIRPGPMGWGFLGIFYLLPIGLFGLMIDFLLQRGLYWRTFVIEISIISILGMLYLWTQRTKTYIIPDNLRDTYIITIYGVDSMSALPKRTLSWKYQIPFPTNGILKTSSSIDDDLPETEMQTPNGVDFNNRTDTFDICFGHVNTSLIKCGDKTYHYQVWKIDHGGTIGSSSNDLDSVEKRLTEYLCEENRPSL